MFLLQKGGGGRSGGGPPDAAGGAARTGGGRGFDPAAMEERMKAEIAKLPAAQRTAAETEYADGHVVSR